MSPFQQFLVIVTIFGSLDLSAGQTEDSLKKFHQETLERHNLYRARHQAPPLVLNDTISAVSQEWAKYLLDNNKFEHRPNNMYGENIYKSWSTNTAAVVNGYAAVDLWYKEVKDYTYGSGFSMATGHFTQVVWKNSKQLGVGWTYKNGTNYVVCNYSPPGNYAGQFTANVLPPAE